MVLKGTDFCKLVGQLLSALATGGGRLGLVDVGQSQVERVAHCKEIKV